MSHNQSQSTQHNDSTQQELATQNTADSTSWGVLVVIPCLNEEAYIQGIVEYCVDELADTPSTIVVADGGSKDRTLSILGDLTAKYSNVTILNNVKKIQSAGVNLAVKEYGASFEYFVRIDVHADYPQRYIQTLVEQAETQSADSVVVSMDTRGKRPIQSLIALAQNSALGNGGSGHRNAQASGQWVEHGHHALMKVQAFLNVGGYDESFSHNEDAELDARLTHQGFRIWLTNQTNLIYYPRSNFSALAKQYFGYGSGRCKNIIKHRTKPRLRQLVPVFVFPSAILALLSPVHWIFVIPFLTWFSASLAAGLLVASKTNTSLGALKYAIALPAMTMHLAWSAGFCIQVIRHLSAHRRHEREIGHEH
ncbi:glycosyltransferase family 2 protein [Vibrio sp. SCSIO 43135]|uniref:glycosyltransferase family 2 protein n=1 Tax=Vibrio sp. SCSIO 43135 TaxID=2819096 RepID=UPI002074ABFA|nr:glycosyltransferase family 2 protein [Vibrio sp. SCSIO 43135]USD43118.1 glycosyltransferase family 2 protein [Vibrio sp. SCSIO 43135]